MESEMSLEKRQIDIGINDSDRKQIEPKLKLCYLNFSSDLFRIIFLEDF